MAPARAKIVFSSIFVLCLLLAGTGWLLFRDGPESQASYAPNRAKPPKVSAPIVQKEPVQQPTAEILSNRIVEYHIDTTLDPDNRTLKGTQTLTWTHPGKKTVNELYFHLYPNAFSSMDSTFMKESGGKLRNDAMPADGFGSIAITDIKTSEGLSLMHRIQYVQPDDGNAKDKTLAKVRLPKPVKGGESITLSIQFEVKLPKIFARMGTADDFVMAGQWFPKISVYEPAGVRGRQTEGWNLHQYHGNSEFYADFGIYSVRIHVPENYIVAGTGIMQSSQIRNHEKVYQFYADDVHDFAWSASPNFVFAEEPFSSAEVPGVRIKLYLDPAHKDLKERYFFAAKAALKYFSKWYGTYPYSTLSIVVPPESGNGAGGMEYPTLVTAFGAKDDSPGYDLERTVIHEIGHQYFYGMLASNEFEEAWLDEGFTSYAEDKLMEQEYGVIPNLPIQASIISSPMTLTQEAWKYGSQDQYALNVYYRAKLLLKGMEQQVGSQTMNKIMSTYAKKYRFKHPTTTDFQKVAEQVTRKSWQPFFDQYVYGSQMADFAVDTISVRKKAADGGKPMYESTVQISKKGGDYPEVPVLFTFTDGHTLSKVWNGTGDRTAFKLSYSAPLAWAMVDPKYSIVIENKHINNYLKADMDREVLVRWNLGITKLIETLLGSLSW
ncbi:M1 family metallopeptidase [Paenibacillus sp. SAF-054]|uniref:M1 family metallopeptidase n=1 Tax=unclassified Paenibacillus TaxID=185978 RepID=UPI003F7DA1B1